jgi:hypothetical protein
VRLVAFSSFALVALAQESTVNYTVPFPASLSPASQSEQSALARVVDAVDLGANPNGYVNSGGTISNDSTSAVASALAGCGVFYGTLRFTTGPLGFQAPPSGLLGVNGVGNYAVTSAQSWNSWVLSHYYASGSFVVDLSGRLQKVTTAGTSGTTTPAWSGAGTGTTTPDGTVLWTDQGAFVGGWSYWSAATAYGRGAEIIDPAGHAQSATGSGGISGGTVPTWNDSGHTTSDGTITWQDDGYVGVSAPTCRVEIDKGVAWPANLPAPDSSHFIVDLNQAPVNPAAATPGAIALQDGLGNSMGLDFLWPK